MPSDMRGGQGRSAICNWRVKCGKKEVFSHERKMKCREFIRDNESSKILFPHKLRLIPPNK